MPLPGNLSTVTVTGVYKNANGSAKTGTVTFVPTQWLRDDIGDVVIPVSPYVAALGSSGSFSAVLVATDDADIDQVWAYRVTEQVDGYVNSFTALLAASLVTVTMSELAPVIDDGQYSDIRGPRGFSVLNGSGAPSAGTGEDNDFYIDTVALEIYGPKAGGVWGSGTALAGVPGPAASVSVGTTTTLAAGSSASVTNVGSASAAILDFAIPAGNTGPQGVAASVAVGSTTTGAAGTSASVVNSGTSLSAVFDFTIPQGIPGEAASVSVGTTTTGVPGTSASVTNVGSASAAILDFVVPEGVPGQAASVSVGTTATLTPGDSASVTNVGSASAAILDFAIPQGDTGATGLGATVAAGSTTTGTPGSSASVVNSGTASAAVFDFTIPEGVQGDPGDAASVSVGATNTISPGDSASVINVGSASAAVFDFYIPQGATGSLDSLFAVAPIDYTSSSFSLLTGDGVDKTSGSLTAAFSNANPASLGVAAAGTSASLSRGDHVHTMPTASDVGAVPDTRTVTAGNGLDGGGALSGDITLSASFAGSTASLGVSAAGTANNVSRGDHVHTMPTASDVGAIASTIVDAKGDLITASADDTPVRLAAGSDGQVLTASVGASAGLVWATPAAGGGDSISPFLLMGA